MKKTVSINLAGTLFHIDEDAFNKLSLYLEAVKNSLKDSEGKEEILHDIEGRIAELFLKKIDSNLQVVSIKELDEVIEIMGQPEDYEVDEEVLEDEKNTQKEKFAPKSLYRDVDHKFLGGVSSGLGHYFGIDPIWIRLIWVLLVVAGLGSPVLVYILLWILVPPALTTAEKLKMKGEPVNISNIEKKFKEKYNHVADKVKNADYDKYGNKIKSGTTRFFDTLGEILKTLINILIKVIGFAAVLLAVAVLISLVIQLIFFGGIGHWENRNFIDLTSTLDMGGFPFWLFSLMIFFSVGIPFFGLAVLGLKMMVSNLKPLNKTIKITLSVIWLLSMTGLTYFGIRQFTARAYEGHDITESILPLSSTDTLSLTLRPDTSFDYNIRRQSGLNLRYDRPEGPAFFSKDLRIRILPSQDSLARIIVNKEARGSSFEDAKKRAKKIDYLYQTDGDEISLDGFFHTDISLKQRNQKVRLTLLIPKETVLRIDENFQSFMSEQLNHLRLQSSGYYQIQNNYLICLNCESRQEAVKDGDSIQNSSSEDWEKRVDEKFKNY